MILQADARRIPLADESVQCVVTSPPYFGLRDYEAEGQLGLEDTPATYVARLVEVFREVRRVLRQDGTVWLNLADSYASSGGSGYQGKNGARADRSFTQKHLRHRKNTPGLKGKNLIGIPWRVAFALQEDGWWLRQDIIWSKPNPTPNSAVDRCTTAHEYIFLLSKRATYYCDMRSIRVRAAASTLEEIRAGYDGQGRKDYDRAGAQDPSKMKARIISGKRRPAGWATAGSHAPADWAREGVQPRGKHAATAPQASGRRLTESVARARAMTGAHTACFGETANRRSVWTVTTAPYDGPHFATFPERLIEPCILAGAPIGGVVFDPFSGTGTTAAVATRLGRRGVGADISLKYSRLGLQRVLEQTPGLQLEMA